MTALTSRGRGAELAQGPALPGRFLADPPQFQRQIPEFWAQLPQGRKLRPQDGGLGLGGAAPPSERLPRKGRGLEKERGYGNEGWGYGGEGRKLVRFMLMWDVVMLMRGGVMVMRAGTEVELW